MVMRQTPKNVIGHVPGKQFTDTGEPFGLKVALITRVDEVNMKADLRILTGGGDRFEIDLTQGMVGPRSFWGGVPEVNSLAIVGYRRLSKTIYDAVILGYIPVGNRSGLRFDPFSPIDPNEVATEDQADVSELVGPTSRLKRLMLNPGDVGGMSSSGAEFVLSKDVNFTNRAGDSIELRDSDRTLETHVVHKVESEAGIKRVAGPVRRGGFFLPDDLFSNSPNQPTITTQTINGATTTTVTPSQEFSEAPTGTFVTSSNPLQLKTETTDGYLGTDELQGVGPGLTGAPTKFANDQGQVSAMFNQFDTYPPVTYASGRRVFYAGTGPSASPEDADAAVDAFVEDRMEMYHTSDLSQEVLEEIDGFNPSPRTTYIERVIGTIVGNDLTTSQGMRQYGQVLKPNIFPDFTTVQPGKFTLEAAERSATNPDLDTVTSAGAFMFRIRPPRGVGGTDFVAAVSKQGKFFLNAPGSGVEGYPSGSRNISGEINLMGALKAYIGASAPDRISAHVTCEGGIHLDIGRDADGNAITVRYRSGVKSIYEGNPNSNDVTVEESIIGVKQTTITGAEITSIQGAQKTVVNGLVGFECDRFTVNGSGGVTINGGELNMTVTGKSQLQYALPLISTIVAGGELKTVIAGGFIQTVLAGAMVYTAAAGAVTFNCAAGAFNIVVGTGAIAASTGAGAVSLSTASGALSLAAAAGAVAITSGLALTLTAGATCVIFAPILLLGGPTAVLGVARGIPTFPPGTPTLDYITGLPLMGAATVLSN